jgi:hypothetical protein
MVTGLLSITAFIVVMILLLMILKTAVNLTPVILLQLNGVITEFGQGLTTALIADLALLLMMCRTVRLHAVMAPVIKPIIGGAIMEFGQV